MQKRLTSKTVAYAPGGRTRLDGDRHRPASRQSKPPPLRCMGPTPPSLVIADGRAPPAPEYQSTTAAFGRRNPIASAPSSGDRWSSAVGHAACPRRWRTASLGLRRRGFVVLVHRWAFAVVTAVPEL